MMRELMEYIMKAAESLGWKESNDNNEEVLSDLSGIYQ